MGQPRRYTLMHGEVEVADLDIGGSGISSIASIRSPDHMPIGTVTKNGGDRHALNEWWTGLCIPDSRRGLGCLLVELSIGGPTEILTESLGLSLSDQYWIRPADPDIAWIDVDFFRNPFSGDVGDLLFGDHPDKDTIDPSSPDNTTEGNLRKRWSIVDDRRILLKHGSRPVYQEPFNEVIASEILELLDIPHVPYGLVRLGGDILSSCRDFVDTDTEFISAYRAMKTRKQRNDESRYGFFVSVCADHGLDAVPFLDRMLSFDYLIANTDRHLNNFGIIRDATTLEWIGFAPLSDNGGSLWFDCSTEDVGNTARLESKPFKMDFEKQLGMVTSFDWLDPEKLDGIPSIVGSVMTEENGWRYHARRDALIAALGSRVEHLRKVAGIRRSPLRPSAMFLSDIG